MFYDIKFYINRKVNYREISIIQDISKGISAGEVILPAVNNFKYVVYTYFNDLKIEENSKQSSIRVVFENIDNFVSHDVFIFIGDESPIRINYKRVYIDSLAVSCNEKLHYKYNKGGTKNLVVYFNYSRLVEKSFLHNELLMQIRPRTSDHLLMISNNFGYWGTASLFDSDGKLIIADVVKLIHGIICENNISDVIFIGGSQGATAALVYSNFFNNCRVVHAASPVPLDCKNQLKHMIASVKPDDLIFIEHLLYNASKIRRIVFYTSSIDHYFDFVKDLFSYSTPSSELKVAEDDSVEHGNVLRFFIKDIYEELSQITSGTE